MPFSYMTQVRTDYQHLEYHKSLWPYCLTEPFRRGTATKIQWKEACSEVLDLLDHGNELNLGNNCSVAKTQENYIFFDNIFVPKHRIEQRDHLRLVEISDDDWDGIEKLLQQNDVLPVSFIYSDGEDVLSHIRTRYNLGYKTQIIDKWNKKSIIWQKRGVAVPWFMVS